MSQRSPRGASSARTRNCGLPGQFIQRADSTTPVPPPCNRSMRNPLWTWWAAKVAPELSSEAGNPTGPHPKLAASKARSSRRTVHIDAQRAELSLGGQAPLVEKVEEDMPSSKNGKAKETVHPCCKYCRKGKACGNSCINRTHPCYQAAGCACDAH